MAKLEATAKTSSKTQTDRNIVVPPIDGLSLIQFLDATFAALLYKEASPTFSSANIVVGIEGKDGIADDDNTAIINLPSERGVLLSEHIGRSHMADLRRQGFFKVHGLIRDLVSKVNAGPTLLGFIPDLTAIFESNMLTDGEKYRAACSLMLRVYQLAEDTKSQTTTPKSEKKEKW